MMGSRQSLTGPEYDIVAGRRYHGHKAGGITVFCKKKMARRRRLKAKLELKNEQGLPPPAIGDAVVE